MRRTSPDRSLRTATVQSSALRIALPYLALLALVLSSSGCTVVSCNRVFPKLAWYWSADAKEQRAEDAADKPGEGAGQGHR